MDKIKLKENFRFAVIAQAISLIVSCSTNLVLPKVVSVTNFSYWQLFIFYATYMPCLSLGLNDGVYLRYGGLTKSQINIGSVMSQYIIGFIMQSIFVLFLGVILSVTIPFSKRYVVILSVLVYFLIYTSHNYFGNIFQAVNETNIYSKSIIIVRIAFLLSQSILILMKEKNIDYYIFLYILSILFALLYLLFKFKSNFKLVSFNMKSGIHDVIISVRVGISLMIANICSPLILGVGRQLIDIRWGLLTFGKISFSLTLMNFVIVFIMQVGLVLFPALRKVSKNELKKYYKKITILLFKLLPVIYILYLPSQFLIKLWLPNYTQSINYLGIILPICFFECKMNLLGNTFFKVLNKQVLLLKVNIITIILSTILCFICAFLLNSLYLTVVSMVASIIFRSAFSDLLLCNDLKINIGLVEIVDIIQAIIFIIFTSICNWWITMIVFIIFLIVRFLWIRGYNFQSD